MFFCIVTYIVSKLGKKWALFENWPKAIIPIKLKEKEKFKQLFPIHSVFSPFLPVVQSLCSYHSPRPRSVSAAASADGDSNAAGLAAAELH